MVAKLRFSPRNVLSKIFPISAWGRTYNCEIAVCDLVAGFTVALTLVPQSIAYASLAGLDPQYGLYASFTGSLVYMFLGTCPQINVGPTALLSLLTFTYTHDTNPDFAVLLCFLGGFVQLFAGVAQLGFLVDFVSLPVVSGFTSASALIIACSQVKGLLGLSFNAETFVDTWKGLFRHIRDVKMADSLLSLGCCVLLISMEQLKRLKLSSGHDKKSAGRQKVLSKVIWFVGVGRNATVVVLGALVAALVHGEGGNPFKLTGQIRPGLPDVGLPEFTSTVGNTTYHFGEMVGHMGTGVLVVPLIGIIANVAIAKAFAAGRVVDATQEIVALGACNVVGAFFRSFPVNGSFTRSAVSQASGVRTPGAGLYTGIIVLLTLSLLTPYFFFIPKAALSSVIICAVLHMVDVGIVKSLWKNSRLDLIPLFATFLSGLFLGIELGILVGVAVDLAILLYFNARPDFNIKIVLDTVIQPFYLVTPTGGLAFPSAAYLREKLNSVHMDPELENPAENPRPVVVDCGTLNRADWTAVQAVKSLANDFKKSDRTLIFLDLKEPVLTKLKVQLNDEFLHASSAVELDVLLAESKSKQDASLQSNELGVNSSIPEIKLDKLSPEESQ